MGGEGGESGLWRRCERGRRCGGRKGGECWGWGEIVERDILMLYISGCQYKWAEL